MNTILVSGTTFTIGILYINTGVGIICKTLSAQSGGVGLVASGDITYNGTTSLSTTISNINTNLTSLNVSPIFCAGYVRMGTSTATSSIYATYGRGYAFGIAWVQTGVMDITMNVAHPSGIYYIVQLTALSNSSVDYPIVANINSTITTSQKFRVDIRTVQDTITFEISILPYWGREKMGKKKGKKNRP